MTREACTNNANQDALTSANEARPRRASRRERTTSRTKLTDRMSLALPSGKRTMTSVPARCQLTLCKYFSSRTIFLTLDQDPFSTGCNVTLASIAIQNTDYPWAPHAGPHCHSIARQAQLSNQLVTMKPNKDASNPPLLTTSRCYEVAGHCRCNASCCWTG